MAAGEKEGRNRVVGSRLNPKTIVSLSRQMLALGALRFEYEGCVVEFGPLAVASAHQKAQNLEVLPLDSATAKRLREEAEEKAKFEHYSLELASSDA